MPPRRKTKKKKKDRDRSPQPLSAAGLMTFFEEDIGGIKIKPELVLALTFLTAVVVIMAHLGIFSALAP